MPNWCMQEVYLHGETSMVQKLYDALTGDEPKFCSVVIPEPDNMFRGLLGDEERKMCEREGRPNWYDWHNDNWNTKWDVGAIEIVDPIQHDDHYPIPTSFFKFACWTAWDAPIPVWEKLHEMGIEVQAEYEVEGCDVVGEFTLGEHHCRKLTDKEIKEREARWEEENTFVRYEEVIGDA